MTHFSRKTSILALGASLLLLALSSLLVLFSSQLLDGAYRILSASVFHREFSMEKWRASIQ